MHLCIFILEVEVTKYSCSYRGTLVIVETPSVLQSKIQMRRIVGVSIITDIPNMAIVSFTPQVLLAIDTYLGLDVYAHMYIYM